MDGDITGGYQGGDLTMETGCGWCDQRLYGATTVNGGTLQLGTGGTTAGGGTLYLMNTTSLVSGTSLVVGAGGTFIFDPSVLETPVPAYPSDVFIGPVLVASATHSLAASGSNPLTPPATVVYGPVRVSFSLL